jgi:hypothetical protein
VTGYEREKLLVEVERASEVQLRSLMRTPSRWPPRSKREEGLPLRRLRKWMDLRSTGRITGIRKFISGKSAGASA